MNRVSFPGMGTIIEAWCEDAGSALRAWFDEVEIVCSRFHPDSEISRVNSSLEVTHELSPLLSAAVAAADQARTLTDGLVDAGVGTAVIDWGYDRTFSEVTGLANGPDMMVTPEWRIEGSWLHRSPGTGIDLGGIVKGWASDRTVDKGLGVVVSAGGDLRSADPGTVVPVIDPWGRVTVEVIVGVGALATSSVAKRRWVVGDREVSHLIDPRTMTPVQTPMLSAVAISDTALEAEAAAKAVLLLGEDGLAWADQQDWIRAAIAIWHDGSVYSTSDIEVAA